MTKINNQENSQKTTFINVIKVVAYLKEHGWKIEKSQAYNHKRDRILRPGKDGLFHLLDVEKYAATHLKMADGSKSADALGKILEEKAQSELDKVNEQIRQLRLKNDIIQGLYVPRDAFNHELAQRAMVFKADVEAFCRSGAAEIINLVGGKKEMIPDLIEYMLGKSAGWLNRYAADREFIVPAAAPAEIIDAMKDDRFDEDGE